MEELQEEQDRAHEEIKRQKENSERETKLLELVLCHLEEWPGQKSELKLLKKEYHFLSY